MEPAPNATPNFKNQEKRRHINGKVLDFAKAQAETYSERAAAKLAGIPRSTARYHAQRQRECSLDTQVLRFFQTEFGMEFLHRLVLVIEFVLSQLAHCGLRLIQEIYELSGLDQLVACSVGKLSQRVKQIEENLIDYGVQQERRLASELTSDKLITCCLDETFPSGNICLVGIEPEANYILIEELADKRDAATWSAAMAKRLANLPVKIQQVTSDEARALIHYTEQHLGAHHSPDLFHVQQDVSKASAAPLRAKLKKAHSAAEQTAGVLADLESRQADYENQTRKSVGRPVDYTTRLAEASVAHESAQRDVAEAEARRDKVRQANKSLGEIYHPFDIDTGKKRLPSRLHRELGETFDVIETTLEDAELSENSLKRIEKARRMIDAMVNTLQFFWLMVNSQVKSLALDKGLLKIFKQILLPAIYWEIHAAKASVAQARQQRLALSAHLYQQLEANRDWQVLSDERRNALKLAATECANIFQRSSSNVEGRNGQLSLFNHSNKRLSARKLKASTVVHNFFIKRQDGSTAAGRFFGKEPDSLIKHLLAVTDHPAAPAKKRSGEQKLNAAA